MIELRDVIARVESSGHAWAMQFESRLFASKPMWLARGIAVIKQLHAPCSEATAEAIASTSWGKWQILGGNLWDPSGVGYTGRLGDYLTDEALQAQTFDSFLWKHGIDFTWEEVVGSESTRTLFITRYNGPGDIAGYWALMQREARGLGWDGSGVGQ